MSNSILQAQVVANPDEAKRRLIEAFYAADCKRSDAAKRLHITRNTYARFAARLGITKELAKIEARAIKEGWHHGDVGGRPRG